MFFVLQFSGTYFSQPSKYIQILVFQSGFLFSSLKEFLFAKNMKSLLEILPVTQIFKVMETSWSKSPSSLMSNFHFYTKTIWDPRQLPRWSTAWFNRAWCFIQPSTQPHVLRLWHTTLCTSAQAHEFLLVHLTLQHSLEEPCDCIYLKLQGLSWNSPSSSMLHGYTVHYPKTSKNTAEYIGETTSVLRLNQVGQEQEVMKTG